MRRRGRYRYDQRPGPGVYRSDRTRNGSCAKDAACCFNRLFDEDEPTPMLLLIPRLCLVLLVGGAGDRAARIAPRRPVPRMVAAIELYQREISATRPACCRFSPSCSHYAIEALRTHGTARGLLLTVRRLVRCRPGGPRGADPVPPPPRR